VEPEGGFKSARKVEKKNNALKDARRIPRE
jgi:hypothetical protein